MCLGIRHRNDLPDDQIERFGNQRLRTEQHQAGVALAQPNRRVVGLEGDGSILMQLGALGTIAAEAPRNLLMIVWDNVAYQITGGQKTVTSSVTDLVAAARALGIAESHWADDEANFEALVDQGLAADVPYFIVAKIDASKPKATTHRDPAQIRETFMRGIGTRTNVFVDAES